MRREFSITSDVAGQKAQIAPLFPAFAAAGFSAVHWCQDWAGEPVFYSSDFARDVRGLAEQNGLRVADVHGFSGTGKTGVRFTDELFVAANVNRAEFAHDIGAEVLVVHVPPGPPEAPERALRRSIAVLEALRPSCERLGVRVAVENLSHPANTAAFFDALFEEFDPEYLGFCYDSGHALLAGWEDCLARYAERTIATHLHDNDGTADQHLTPGQGKVDWPMVLGTLKRTGYAGTVNLEVGKSPEDDLLDYCKRAHAAISARWAGTAAS